MLQAAIALYKACGYQEAATTYCDASAAGGALLGEWKPFA